MLISGIAGSKHPTLRRGDAIPMAPKEKAKYAAIRAWNATAPAGHDYASHKAIVRDFYPIAGSKGQYDVTADVMYRTLRHKDERVFAPKTASVKVRFKEVKDSLGIDDIEIVSINQI